jgi:hypothetical protein
MNFIPLPPQISPAGLSLVGIFLLVATLVAALAATTIMLPGTPLDRIWELNPRAHRQLAPLGRPIGALFLLLAAALATAAFGWFRRRRWGWLLTVTIIAVQLLGDFVNALSGHFLDGAIGVSIASALLSYLLRGNVKRAFAA